MAPPKRFPAIFALVLDSRWVALGLALGGVGLAVAGHLGFGWRCPLAALGLSCPGCGITRSVQLLVGGDWLGALRTHAFGPGILLGWAGLCVAALAPDRWRRSWAVTCRRWEERSGFSTWILVSMVVYWLGRLALAGLAG